MGKISWLERLRANPLARVGPGFVTGAADDDPSGIATYAQAGAQFGLNMLWTMPLSLPIGLNEMKLKCGIGLALIRSSSPCWAR